MKHASFFVDYIGSKKAPKSWVLYNGLNLQRFYYIKGGKGYMLAKDGNKKPFEKNHIYIFPYNINQDFESDSTDSLDHLYIDFISSPPIISSDVLDYDLDKCPKSIKTLVDLLDEMIYNNEATAEEITPHKRLENIVDAPHGSTDEVYQAMYALIQSIFILLSAQKEIPYSNDTVVSDALKYISRYYNKEISISELAKKSGYSTEYFIRRFSAIMGMTPYAYLRNYRLWRANELISHGLPLIKVAEEVGYKNVSSLSRELAKYKNMR